MKLRRRVLITIILLFFISLFLYLLVREGTLPVDKNDKIAKIFVISKGQSLTDIANNLANQKFIRNKIVFYIVVKQLGIDKNIQAGDYRLSPSMSMYQVAKNLTHGSLDKWITIIEGLRKEEIAEIIASEVDIPESEFIKEAREGYLFPDTYLVPKDATVENVLDILTSNFTKRLQQAKRETSKKNDFSDEEIVILASLIEREARFEDDRPQVANILLRRINDGHKLQVDATIQYVLGYQPKEKRWWKKHTTFSDLETDSSYNTYLKYGLPPTPICNPGLSSIKAAFSADGDTPYLFYVSDKTGKMHYARNSEEHQRNIDKYLK